MNLDPTITSASSSCYRCNVYTDKCKELGLDKFTEWVSFRIRDS
jgi:hypothetical protein